MAKIYWKLALLCQKLVPIWCPFGQKLVLNTDVIINESAPVGDLIMWQLLTAVVFTQSEWVMILHWHSMTWSYIDITWHGPWSSIDMSLTQKIMINVLFRWHFGSWSFVCIIQVGGSWSFVDMALERSWSCGYFSLQKRLLQMQSYIHFCVERWNTK